MTILAADGYAVACPKCGGVQLSKYGFHKTKDGKKQKYQCGECNWIGSGVEYADEDVIAESTRIARKLQKAQDSNRVKNKAFREHARIANMFEEINDKLIIQLDKHKFKSPKSPKKRVIGSVGVAHFSDLHFNELIDMPFNKYDFNIASKRIQKYTRSCINEFKYKGVKRVIFALGGDLLNSDRRTDEITSQATNRTQAMMLAVEILQQSLKDFAKSWAVDVVWVCGNEGRVNKELGFSNIIASDNYDHAIPMIMRHLFSDFKGVNFHIPENSMETVFVVNSKTFVLLHGHGGGGGVPSKKAQTIRAKYAERGICVDYVIFGHIHEAYISELFARSGSPAGGNSFSDNALGLGGKASLNCYIVSEQGEISGTVIPLQETEGWDGYEIDYSLAAYNAKSLDKTITKTKILEITV